MGQRRELRRPAGVRKMLADARRTVNILKRQIKDLTGNMSDLSIERDMLRDRFRVVFHIGRLFVMKDMTGRKVK